MRRPETIQYGLDDFPPRHISLFIAVQQISFLGVYLVISPLFGRTLHLESGAFHHLMAATLLVSGIGVVIQAAGRLGVGSGYFCPLQVTSSTFPAIGMASAAGGLELAFGMVSVLGLAQLLFGELFRRARGIFSVEVAGVAVTLIGIGLGFSGLKLAVGIDTPSVAMAHDGLVAVLSLGTMIACNVWSAGRLRMFSAMVGLVVGFLSNWAIAGLVPADLQQLADAALFMRPHLPAFGWKFDPELVPAFVVVGLALSLHGFGALAAAQRFNDADWKRPDMHQVCRGIRAEGVANLFAALFNSLPLTSSGGAVGLAAATGCTSRIPAYWLGATMILFAFSPKVIFLWLLVPVPVIGAAAIFLSAFTIMAGMQMIASRMLDNRKILVVGLALTFGLSHEPLRHFYDREVPASLHPISMSSVALGVTVATLLSALFRIGARTRRRETFDAHHSSMDEVIEFLERQGRSWGARPGVVRRAEYATWQAFEILADNDLAGRDESDTTPIELETVFDEFTFTVIARYRGRAVPVEARRPTQEEMIADETAVLRMAGYLLRRLADSVQTWDDEDGRAELTLKFTD